MLVAQHRRQWGLVVVCAQWFGEVAGEFLEGFGSLASGEHAGEAKEGAAECGPRDGF